MREVMSEMSLVDAFIGIKSWNVEFVTRKVKINSPSVCDAHVDSTSEGREAANFEDGHSLSLKRKQSLDHAVRVTISAANTEADCLILIAGKAGGSRS
jgi:hypothetical protein